MNNFDYKHLIKTAPYGFAYHKIILDESGKPVDYEFLEVNPAFEKLTGLDAHDIIGKTIRQAIPGIENSDFDWIEFYGEVALSGKVQELEQYSESLGKWYSVHVYSPEKEYFATVFNDITESKKQNELLESGKDYLKAILQTAVEGFWVVDNQANIIDVNDAYCKMTGFSREEILKMKVYEIDCLEESEDTARHMKTVMEQGYDSFITKHLKKDGSTLDIEMSVSFLDMDGGKFICFGRDITERLKSEKALQESEELHRKLLTTVPDLIIRTDTQGNITFINEFAFPALSYVPREQLHGKNMLSFIAEEDLPRAIENTKLMFEHPLGPKEYKLKFEDNTLIDAEVNGDVIYDSEHNPTGMVYVIRDITERKESERKLRTSEEKFKNISMDMPFNVTVFKPDGTIIFANQITASLVNMTPDEIVGKNFLEFLPEDSAKHTRRMLDSLTPENPISVHIQEFISPDGKFYYHEWTNRAVYDDNNNIIYMQSIGQDVTERKKAEIALKESEALLKASIEAVTEPFAIIDADNYNIVMCNSAYGGKDAIGKKCYEVSHRFDKPCCGDNDPCPLEIVKISGNPCKVEHIHYDNYGKERYIDLHAFPVFDDEGNIKQIIEFGIDVTSRKQADLALRESEERYRRISENTNDFTYTCIKQEKKYIINWIAGAVEKLTGYTADEVIEKTCWKFLVHPEDEEIFIKNVVSLAVGEETDCELRVITKNNEIKWLSVNTSCIYDEKEKAKMIYGGCSDITDMKIAQSELAHSNDLMKYIIEHTHSSIAVHDTDMNYVYVSNRYYEDFNLSNRNIIGKNHYDVFPDLPQKLRDVHKRVLAGEIVRETNDKWHRPDGSFDWTNWECRPWYKHDGSIAGLIIYIEFITERVRALKELEYSYALLKYIIEHTHSSIAVHDTDLRYIYVSNRYLQEYKVKETDVIGRHHYDVFPDLPQKWRDVHQRTLLGEVISADDDPFEREDGSIEWTRWECRPWRKSDGSIGGIIIYTEVITERKNAELALKESEEKHRRLFETMSQGVLYQSADSKIISVNPACLRILGLTLDQIIGKTAMDPRWRMILEDGTPIPGDQHPTMLALSTGKKIGPVIRGIYIPEEDRYAWLSVIATPLFKPGEDKPYQAYATFDDITERKLNEEQIKFQAKLLTEIGESVIATDLMGRIIYWNKAAEKLYGWTAKETLGQNIINVTPTAENQDYSREIMEKLKNGENWTGELLLSRKDGSKFYALVIDAPFYDEKNELIGIIGISTDITERKSAEIALQESYTLLNNLTEQMPGVVYQYLLYPDGSSCFPYSSKGMWNIYEVTSDEVREDASPVFTRIHPDDYDMVSNLINESARNQTNFVCEFRVILPEQGLRWRHSNAKPQLLPDGSTLWYGIITDVTEQKNAEKAIRENEEKLRAIFQTANIGINITDKNGRILFVNDWWINFIGYTYEELTSKSNIDFTHPDDKEMSRAYLRKIFTKELSQYRIEKRFIHKSGEERWADLSVTPILDTSGKIDNIVGMTIDISERKKSETDLKQKNDELEQQYEEYMQLNEVLQATNNDLEIAKSKAEESDRLKTAFLQNMSHEIRTPLNGIIGFSHLLEDEDISKDEIKECTHVIKQSGNRLIEIVNNVLDISKIETGQIEISNKTFSVNSLIVDLYSFFAPMAEQKELNLNYLTPLQDEDSQIFADDAKLHQILSNLISNALKFTQYGAVSYGYQFKNDRIEFFVEDTGIGIPQDMQNIIFERFTQVESGITRNYEGAGLGLSICQGLVNLLGGEIRLESEIGIGSKFCFDIPLIRDIVKQVENNEINENKIIGGKMKILIAEDDYTSYLYLCNVFKKDSYEIIQAKNGLQAVDFVKNIPDIDLVLMDIRMPQLDGIEATKQIKQLRPDLPIIAQTAYAFIEERKVIMAAGCDEYISKPIDKTLLLSLVSKYLKIDE